LAFVRPPYSLAFIVVAALCAALGIAEIVHINSEIPADKKADSVRLVIQSLKSTGGQSRRAPAGRQSFADERRRGVRLETL
jgi:hypothetical protein